MKAEPSDENKPLELPSADRNHNNNPIGENNFDAQEIVRVGEKRTAPEAPEHEPGQKRQHRLGKITPSSSDTKDDIDEPVFLFSTLKGIPYSERWDKLAKHCMDVVPDGNNELRTWLPKALEFFVTIFDQRGIESLQEICKHYETSLSHLEIEMIESPSKGAASYEDRTKNLRDLCHLVHKPWVMKNKHLHSFYLNLALVRGHRLHRELQSAQSRGCTRTTRAYENASSVFRNVLESLAATTRPMKEFHKLQQVMHPDSDEWLITKLLDFLAGTFGDGCITLIPPFLIHRYECTL